MSAERLLDVSGLEPPEPLETILAVLPSLGPGEYLRVLHRREPHLLYALLEQQGFAWQTTTGTRTAFEIRIWRAADSTAAAAARSADPSRVPPCGRRG